MEKNSGKLNITTLDVAGFIPALHGMRNPMDSWDKNDSYLCDMEHCFECPHNKVTCYNEYTPGINIGANDLDLAKRLVKGGAEHRKFLRQIQVWADMTMPRYWWQEMDTYHWVVKNSCSTMHTLHKRDFTLEDFYLGENPKKATLDMIEQIIEHLNYYRMDYFVTKDYGNIIEMKRALPESFLQMRTISTNYECLMNIYHQRKNHRQKEEWQDTFCKWCESLPYFVELCVDK